MKTFGFFLGCMTFFLTGSTLAAATATECPPAADIQYQKQTHLFWVLDKISILWDSRESGPMAFWDPLPTVTGKQAIAVAIGKPDPVKAICTYMSAGNLIRLTVKNGPSFNMATHPNWTPTYPGSRDYRCDTGMTCQFDVI